MEANDVLHLVQKAYAGISTYVDVGRVTSDGNKVEGTFKTRIERSLGRFSFEFTSRTGDVHKLEGVDQRITYTTLALTPQPVVLADGIAALTGITFGSIHSVVKMMMPAWVPGRGLLECTSPRIAPEESVGAARCFVIDLAEEQGGHQIVVDGGSFLLRAERDSGAMSAQAVEYLRARGIADATMFRSAFVITYDPDIVS